MNIFIGIIISLYNYRLLHRSQNLGMILFCILYVCSPVYYLGNIQLSYGYVFLPFLLLWYYRYGTKDNKVGFILIPLICITLIVIVSSFISIGLYGINGNIQWFSIIGTIRCLITLYILAKSNILRKNFFRIIKCIILINVFAMSLELYLFLTIGPIETMRHWEELYGTLGNTGSIEQSIESGTYGRLHGTFLTSAFPGTLSMTGIGLFLIKYFKDRTWGSFFMILASVYIGLCSSSKRFFLGATFIVLFCILIKKVCMRKRKIEYDYKLPLVIFIFIILLTLSYEYLNEFLALDYYAEYLTSGNFSSSLDSRFSKNNGVVNSMIPYIRHYWLTGVGDIEIKNVNVTDSEFYCALFKSGICSIVLYFLIFIQLFILCISKRDVFSSIILFVIFFEFFISTEFYSHLGIIFLSFVISQLAKYTNWKNNKDGFKSETKYLHAHI